MGMTSGPQPDANGETLFLTVRLWQEHLTYDKCEWRGRVQNVGTGDVFHFRDWRQLVEGIQAMASDADISPAG